MSCHLRVAHALPEELLSTIFILASCIDNSKREFDDFSVDNNALVSTWPLASKPRPSFELPYSWYRDKRNTRLAVSHVCKHWRFVALRTPLLWSRIAFGSHNAKTGSESSPSSSSAAYLTRSSSTPLSILLIFSNTPMLDHILESLAAHFARVRELRVLMYYPLGEDDMERIFGHSAPLLESLRFDGLTPLLQSGHHDVSISVSAPPFKGSALRLRSLQFKRVFINFSSPRPFQTLTKLELSPLDYDQRPTYDQFVSALTASQVLETLMLRYASPESHWENWPQKVIRFPALRRLSILHESLNEAASLVHRFQAPKLESLQLTFYFNDHRFHGYRNLDDRPGPNGGDFLVRELTQTRQVGEETLGVFVEGVETLVLDGYFLCSDPSISQLYTSAPKLKAIFLNVYHLLPSFIHTLHDNPEYAPNLQTLALAGAVMPVGRVWNLAQLVKSRARAGFPLRGLCLDPEAMRDLEEEDELYLLKAVRCAFWTQAPERFYMVDHDESDEEV